MLVSDAIDRIRLATHDITEEYTDYECVNYLNEAVHQIASTLMGGASPFMVKTTTLKTGDTLPVGFCRTCGTFPFRITGGKVELLTDAEELPVRYFSQPELLTGATGEAMPFDQEQLNELAVRLAVIYASNENEFDVTQDTNIMQMIAQATQKGFSG